MFFSDVALGPMQAGSVTWRLGVCWTSATPRAARGGRHEPDRRRDRHLGQQVPLRLVATDHGDPRGRHGRQSQHRRRARLDAAFVTPPYPDWPSGLNGFIGAVTQALSRLNPGGPGRPEPTSAAAGGITRHYEYAADIAAGRRRRARPFRHPLRRADEVAFQMGTQANRALDYYFAPAT